MELVGNVQLVAGNSSVVGAILALLKEEGIDAGNPDVYVHEYSSFGVDEARDIAAKAMSRALSAPRRVFVIVTPGMTSEAQNALLKTLEEPSGNALFFIVMPSPQTMLATLRSRAQLLSLAPEAKPPKITLDARAFLEAKPPRRLEMLKPLLDKDEGEERNIAGSIAFLSALEYELSAEPSANSDSLEAIYLARKYIGDKGSLMKALLEQVALLT